MACPFISAIRYLRGTKASSYDAHQYSCSLLQTGPPCGQWSTVVQCKGLSCWKDISNPSAQPRDTPCPQMLNLNPPGHVSVLHIEAPCPSLLHPPKPFLQDAVTTSASSDPESQKLPKFGDPSSKSPLAVNSCMREGLITHNTDAHSGPSASGLGQTEPAPSPRSTGPSWSPALCRPGSGNLCELWRRGHAGELGNSGDGALCI